MKQRNADIDLFKFLFSWLIVLFHLSSRTKIGCVGGFFGVDYFLIVSGFFLFRSFEKQRAEGRLSTPGAYFLHRFGRFFPWMATALVFAFYVSRIDAGQITGTKTLLSALFEDVWELLLVKWCGLTEDGFLLNPPGWTVSSMLLAGFVLWGCLYYGKEPFRRLLLPVTLMTGFAVWRHLPSADYSAWLGFTVFGTLRAWLDMCLGWYCLRLSDALARCRFKRLGRGLLTAFECVSMAFVFAVTFLFSSRFAQWSCMLLFLVDIAVASSGCSYLNAALSKLPFLPLLGEFSFSLYLIHLPFITLYLKTAEVGAWRFLPLRFVVLISLAACAHLLVTKLLIRLFRRLSPRLRAALCEKDSVSVS